MAFGLSSTGFEKKRLVDIKAEIEASLQATFGPYINLLPESVFSQLTGIFADREASIWELAEAVYNSQYPDTADGAALDNVVAITGITRLPATASVQKKQLLFGSVSTLVPAGTVFSVQGNPNSRFQTSADATLAAGTDEVQGVSFSATPNAGTWKLTYNSQETAALAYNATASQVQTALNVGLLSGVVVTGSMTGGFVVTFSGADGKQDHPQLVVSQNSLTASSVPVVATVSTTTPGVPQAVVDCVAQATGPTPAPAHTLSVIETPVSGLSSTRNPTDAIVGRNIETDLELRARRENTLQVAGAGTAEAIRSRLLGLDGVTDVIVFENTALIPDLDGRPAKSFEAVVNGGDAQTIVDTIWKAKPAGIQTVGNQSGSATDSMGSPHSINWSLPTQKNVYLEVDLTTNFEFPANGVAIVKQLLVDYGNALGIGKDVIIFGTKGLSCAFEDVPGITDIAIRIGLAPAPTLDDNIVIAPNEIANFDTSRTTVTKL